MNFEQEQILEFIPVEKNNVMETIERIKSYVKHYETTLKYTKKSVKQMKLKEELKWWKKELVSHEVMLSEM